MASVNFDLSFSWLGNTLLGEKKILSNGEKITPLFEADVCYTTKIFASNVELILQRSLTKSTIHSSVFCTEYFWHRYKQYNIRKQQWCQWLNCRFYCGTKQCYFPTLTQGAGQTNQQSLGGFANSIALSEEPSSGSSVSMDWTIANSGTSNSLHIAAKTIYFTKNKKIFNPKNSSYMLMPIRHLSIAKPLFCWMENLKNNSNWRPLVWERIGYRYPSIQRELRFSNQWLSRFKFLGCIGIVLCLFFWFWYLWL